LVASARGFGFRCGVMLKFQSRDLSLAHTWAIASRLGPGGGGGTRAFPVVLGGDLNLGSAGPQDVRACVPSGYVRRGDGGVQYVLATVDFSLASDRSIDMNRTTDHPGLLVALTP